MFPRAAITPGMNARCVNGSGSISRSPARSRRSTAARAARMGRPTFMRSWLMITASVSGASGWARLMRAAHIRGVTLRRFVITTRRDPAAKPVTDLVERRFYAQAPNRLWVADATYIPTWTGFLYLAMVLDVYSRKIVGWAMGNQLNTELMLAALDMAIAQR